MQNFSQTKKIQNILKSILQNKIDQIKKEKNLLQDKLGQSKKRQNLLKKRQSLSQNRLMQITKCKILHKINKGKSQTCKTNREMN